jgi:hypothetical protein
MAGGGTAPSMKMSDVFILVGMSIVVGGFIMHAWVTPIALDGDQQTLESGASMLESDTLTFDVEALNESRVVIQIYDEEDSLVFNEAWTLAAGDSVDYEFKAVDGGFYTYMVTFESGEGEALVNVGRATMLDFIAYPFGIAFIGFGLYKRNLENEVLSDVILDAELEG